METISLVLDGDGTCGLRLDGGGKHRPIFVSKLHRRGRAHRAGVRIGDEVVSVCGISCNSLDAQTAQDIIRNTNNARIQIRRRQQTNFTQSNAYDDFDSDMGDVNALWQPPPPPSSHRSVYTFNKNISAYQTNAPPFRTNESSSFIVEDVTGYNEHFNRPLDSFYNNDLEQNTKYRKVEYGLNYNRPDPTKHFERHVSKAYIVPGYEKVESKELHKVFTHAQHYVKEHEHDKFKERFHKPATEIEDTPSPTAWKPKLQSISEYQKPATVEEVIIWSSKPLPEPSRPPLFSKPPSFVPKPPPIKVEPPPPPPPVVVPPIPPTPPPPPSPPKVETTAEPSPGVVVNEDLIEAGLLTRGVVTAAGVPVEVHLEKKKLFSDSSFYEDPGHKYPTIEEQIKMARKVANLLTSHTGKTGKGQRMFQKKQEQSANWVIDLDPLAKESIERERLKKKMMEETYDMAFHDGKGPFDQKSRVERAKELEIMRLKEEKSLHNVVPFDLCAKLANELKQDKGKGGHLFTKRREESKNWVASENDPLSTVNYKPYKHELNPFKKPLSFTPLKSTQISAPTKPSHITLKPPQEGTIAPVVTTDSFDNQVPRNRLKDMINIPRAAMTPWDSIVNTGNLDKAFEHLKDRFYLDGSDVVMDKWVGGGDVVDGTSPPTLNVEGGAGVVSWGLNSPLQTKSFMPPHQPRSFSSQSQSSYVKYQPIKFQPRFM